LKFILFEISTEFVLIDIHWFKCKGGVWCELTKLDLEHKSLRGMDGVFILWHGPTSAPSIIRIGSGNISTELKKLKRDLSIIAFFHLGLNVTWAELPLSKAKGVHNFLVNSLHPRIDEETPQIAPVEAPLPWHDEPAKV
jgi:hypothetical protein